MANIAYKQLDDDEPPYTPAGLTSAQAAKQQEKWGKNEIPEEKEPVRIHAGDDGVDVSASVQTRMLH